MAKTEKLYPVIARRTYETEVLVPATSKKAAREKFIQAPEGFYFSYRELDQCNIVKDTLSNPTVLTPKN